jgi:hypothetical protein
VCVCVCVCEREREGGGERELLGVLGREDFDLKADVMCARRIGRARNRLRGRR